MVTTTKPRKTTASKGPRSGTRGARKPTTTVAAYGRISYDDEKKGRGVARQQTDMERVAQREDDWVVSWFMNDNDLSASRYATKEREDYETMMALLRAGRFQILLVDDVSRFTREHRPIEDLCDLGEAGLLCSVSTVSGMQYDITTPEGRNALRQAATSNSYYPEYISKQVKRKKRELVEEGFLPGGSPSFGYASGNMKDRSNPVRSGTVIDEREAEAIKDARDFVFAQSVTLGAPILTPIAQRWNDDGYRTRSGALWSANDVKVVLTNPTIAGLIALSKPYYVRSKERMVKRYSREREIVGKGKWPKIISEDDHYRLVAILTDPSRKNRNPKRRKLLTGFVRCECGNRMFRDARYYRCQGAPSRPDACGHNIIASDALDEFISAAVLEVLKDSKRLRRALVPKRKSKATNGPKVDPVAIQRQIDELGQAWKRGELPGGMRTFVTLGKELNDELAAARVAQAAEYDDDNLALAPFTDGDVEKRWRNLDLDGKRTVLSALFGTVTIKRTDTRGYALDDSRITAPTWKV